MTMKKYGAKFALILGLTLIGLISIWPPKDKLKTGIDLSGGTILQYEVTKTGAAAGSVNIDELITALKRRINPEGVLDIPIRSIGNTRIEIILPKATAEEADAYKTFVMTVAQAVANLAADLKQRRWVVGDHRQRAEAARGSAGDAGNRRTSCRRFAADSIG